MTPEEIRALVAEGKVAICANKNHKCLDPQGVGSMLKTKINVNLGVSKDCKDYDIEMNFTTLETTKYKSDGDPNTIVIPANKQDMLGNVYDKNVITY